MTEPAIIRAEHMPATPTVPVAIIGAGACGMMAALRLREAGVECVLLERDATPSGSTALSSGFIPAAGTRIQAALGIADSRERFAEDIQTKAQGHADADLVLAYVDAVAGAIDALSSRHGIGFDVLDGFLYPGHRVRRMHAVSGHTGAALMHRLETAVIAAGADIVTQALVREIWIDEAECVLGVGFQRPDERIEHLACDQLLLACNGFGGNSAMVAQWLPEMANAPFAGHAGNDGSAIAWGRQLGAGLADLGGYQGHGSWVIPQGALMTWAVMMQGGVQVNTSGKRFHDETQGYSEAAVAVLGQPGGIAWNVFDAPLLELARQFPDFIEAEKAGAVRTASDTTALARLICCPEAELQRTLGSIAPGKVDDASNLDTASKAGNAGNAWNAGNDVTGRRFERVLTPPYHAVKVTGALFHTQGGLLIDAHCRVQRLDGIRFPNLLAAGGAARGVSGNAVWGYLSGNGLLSAIGGGWIAGGTMASALSTTLHK